MTSKFRQFCLTRGVVIFAITTVLLLARAPKLYPNLLAHPPQALFHMSNASTWIQPRLTSLYETTDSHATFQDTFDQAFSHACEVRLDHAVQPLQTFRDGLMSQRAGVKHVSVTWNAADLISTNDNKREQPAVVAGAFVVTRSFPFRIRASLAQRVIHVHFSAKIEQDVNVQGDDQRRITSFYYTAVDKTPPIHFVVPRVAQEGGSDDQK